jgi:hypothetical protein
LEFQVFLEYWRHFHCGVKTRDFQDENWDPLEALVDETFASQATAVVQKPLGEGVS